MWRRVALRQALQGVLCASKIIENMALLSEKSNYSVVKSAVVHHFVAGVALRWNSGISIRS
jgi:hypothetical protein